MFQFLYILTNTYYFLLLKLIAILMDVIFKSIIFYSFLLKTFVLCGFQNSTIVFLSTMSTIHSQSLLLHSFLLPDLTLQTSSILYLYILNIFKLEPIILIMIYKFI